MRTFIDLLKRARFLVLLGVAPLLACPSARNGGAIPDGGSDAGSDRPGDANPIDQSISDHPASDRPDAGGSDDAPPSDGGPGDASNVNQIIVTTSGNGIGLVTSDPAGISCGNTCSVSFNAGATVTLHARTSNGSNSFFSGWSGGGCSGPFHDCTVTVNGSVSVQATFTQMTNNLIFVTSTSLAATRGRATAYDTDCNSIATAAGINDAGGAAYVAYVSDTASNAATRLGNARGWVRMDSKPFTDTLMGLFNNNQVMNPIRFDENGQVVGPHAAPVEVMTGTSTSGLFTGDSANDSCHDWTMTSNAALAGDPAGGPFFWDPNGFEHTDCQPHPVICMGKARSAAIPTTTISGKLIWLSPAWPGFPAPDQHCQSALPSGVTSAKALIARSTAPASSVVNASTSYYRPDGTFVGTGAQLGAGGPVASGIWQSANGAYSTVGPIQAVLTGRNGGTPADNCNDWQPGSGTMARAGDIDYYETWWDSGSSTCPLDPTASGFNSYFYCVQTAP
jgi:hypothetical protein